MSLLMGFQLGLLGKFLVTGVTRKGFFLFLAWASTPSHVVDTISIGMGFQVTGQSLLSFVSHSTRGTSEWTVIGMDFGHMDNVIALVDEGHFTIPALVLLFCKMPGNVPIQVLLGIKSCSTGDTFEVLKS